MLTFWRPAVVSFTVVGLSSFLECVAISYERPGHMQYYCDCSVERLTFPLSAQTLLLPIAVLPHRLPPTSGLQHLHLMVGVC